MFIIVSSLSEWFLVCLPIRSIWRIVGRYSEDEVGLKDSVLDAVENEERIVPAERVRCSDLHCEMKLEGSLKKRMFSLQVCYKYLKWKIWIMSNVVEEHNTESWVYAWTQVWEGRQLSRELAIRKLSRCGVT